jgi:hypothetical protein
LPITSAFTPSLLTSSPPAGPDGLLHLHEIDVAAVGVATGRRAWIEKKDVLNTLPLTQLLKHLPR